MADISVSNCRAASSWSVPSHASMFTGKLAHEHGIHTYNRDYSILNRRSTITGMLPENYNSIGVSANVFAGPTHGFDTLFDEFVDPPRYQPFVDGENAVSFYHNSDDKGFSLYLEYIKRCLTSGNVSKSLVNGISSQIQHLASGSGLPSLFDDGGKVMQKVIRRKAEQASGPTFLFANFMEAHTPYEYMRGMDRSMISAPLSWTSAGESIWDIHNDPEKYEDYLEYRREFYAASVDYLDRLVSSLIEDIRESSDRPVTFIITSDHGENNGFPHEDYLIDHKSSLSESLLHVPLEIIDAPEDVEFKQRFVSHLSLPDLVTALAQGTMPDVSQDVVSAEHMGMGAGEKPPEDERYWDRAMRCVYQGNRKVVYDSLGNVEEYNIDVNRSCWQTSSKELDNVPEFVSDQFSENITEAKENAEKQQTDMDIDPATEERLEDLGYR